MLVLCDFPYNRHCVSNLYVVRFNVQIIAGVLTSGWSRSTSLHKTVHGGNFKLDLTPRVINVLDARSPTLYNADTDEYLQITGDILAGDIITVTTKTGNKTVTLDRGGVKTNIINRLVSGSTWLTLREGRNRFYLRGTGLQNLKVTIVHTNAYLGV